MPPAVPRPLTPSTSRAASRAASRPLLRLVLGLGVAGALFPLTAAATGADAQPGAAAAVAAAEGGLCEGFGPQTPRDIEGPGGANPVRFPLAPASSEMNLCNIHFHTNAEHRGPGFRVSGGKGEHGGWRCNGTEQLTEEELTDPLQGRGACKGLVPGDTVEVHWVHSSCDVGPGHGLGACLSDSCANPTLRVEAQVFLAVNDPQALDFGAFDYAGPPPAGGRHQPRALPGGTGAPVVFMGSTTGPSYTEAVCSPLQVTWSVRPQCARIDIMTLHRWCARNAFEEDHAHGVRQLVTAPELLAPISLQP